MANHRYQLLFLCHMLLACRAVQDSLHGPTSPSIQPYNSGTILQTLDLFSDKKPVTRSTPEMKSDDVISLNGLRNAARELPLPLIDQSVAQRDVIQDPTYQGKHDMLADNSLSVPSTNFRGDHMLVDSLELEVQSALPRYDVYVNHKIRILPSSAETTREESTAPFEYSMMIPPHNRPETTMNLLANFALPPETETTCTHEFDMNSALPPAHSQARSKRLVMEDFSLDNSDVDGEAIGHLTKGPADKRAKIDDAWSKTGQNPLTQHQSRPPTDLDKSNLKKKGVFPKGMVFTIGRTSNEHKSMEKNLRRIALVNHYDNKLKNKYLASNFEPKMESLDFNLDTMVAEGPSQHMKRALKQAFESIDLDTGNNILLNFQTAAKIFEKIQKHHFGSIACENARFRGFSRALIRKRLAELSQNQDQWFKFWERRSGIHFEEELKGKALPAKEKTLLVWFLFYVDMVNTIIPSTKSVQTLKTHKLELFQDALKIFQDFKDNDQVYKNTDIEDETKFMDNGASLTWSCIYLWLSKGERSDLESLASSRGAGKHRGFKNFFDIIFKLTSGSLNHKTKPGPKFSQHL
ncbi:hypothetical protein MJO29_011094 [Puccinia striiformis f. sp. tritici]|nr:hypothetical protein MJO29_011094 [Puccinia striiformis f. sp. tritici]